MKPTYTEMRDTLQNDPVESLLATYEEYHDDEPYAGNSEDKPTLIDFIMDKMVEHGHCSPPRSNSDKVKLSDIAREMGVDPKVARDKLRRHLAAGKSAPESLKPKGWVFNKDDEDLIMNIIRPKK